MANTRLLVPLPGGISGPIVKLAKMASPNTIANGSGDTLTEQGTVQGLYTATITESLEGTYIASLETSGGTQLGTLYVNLKNDSKTYICGELAIISKGTHWGVIITEVSDEMADLEIHQVGAYGYKIVHTVMDKLGPTLGSALDISSYDGTKEIVCISPKGETLIYTAAFVTDGTDGEIDATRASGDFDAEPGNWKRNARVQNAGGTVIWEDEPVAFVVGDIRKRD